MNTRTAEITAYCINLTTGEVVAQERTARTIYGDPLNVAYDSWLAKLRRVGFLNKGDRYRICLRLGHRIDEPIPARENFQSEKVAR